MTTPIRLLAEGLSFPEGPVALDDGSVLVVEIRSGAIARITPEGSVARIATTGGGPNGAALGPDGRLYVCNNGGMIWTDLPDGLVVPGKALGRGSNQPPSYVTGSIQVVDLETGEVDALYSSCGEYALTSPNDIVFDADGGFYFTDTGKRRDREMDYGGLYYARTDGSEIRQLVHPLIVPNGVGLSPAGDRVYVAETLTARVWCWNVAGPGELHKGHGPGIDGAELLCTIGDYSLLDSLAVEAEGNVCLATVKNPTITVVSPDGAIVEVVELPTDDPIVTNICFGGADLRTAYITTAGRGRLYEAEWARAGLALNARA
jgi:gluconolactonase